MKTFKKNIGIHVFTYTHIKKNGVVKINVSCDTIDKYSYVVRIGQSLRDTFNEIDNLFNTFIKNL